MIGEYVNVRCKSIFQSLDPVRLNRMPSFALLGCGGHAKVIISVIRARFGHDAPVQVYDDDEKKVGMPFFECCKVKSSKLILTDCCKEGTVDYLCLAIGDNASRQAKRDLFDGRVQWANALIHPSAVVDTTSCVGVGSVICAGTIIQPDCTVGDHCIVNTKSSVDHDCKIGDFVHLAPGSTLCGHVQVGNQTFIGAGAIVRNGVSIGPSCILGMGSILIRSITGTGEVWMGAPAFKKG